jgi:hypothetical protein
MNQMVLHRQTNLAPDSLDGAFRLADAMSAAKLVPAHLQGKPSDCLLVIEQALRWGMSPFAVAQETSVIQGKLMYSGKLTAAVVNGLGNISKRLSYRYDGTGDNRSVTVSAQFQGETEPREIKVELREAKTANKFWVTQTDQQLAYYGARKWARLHAPDLMLGIYSPEEFEPDDMPQKRKPTPPAPNVMLAAPQMPPHDPETGEVLESGIPGFLDRRSPATKPAGESAPSQDPPATHPESGADNDESRAMFVHSTEDHIQSFDDAKELADWWKSTEQKRARRDFGLNTAEVDHLVELVKARHGILTNGGNGK